jgi:hypothetical protein
VTFKCRHGTDWRTTTTHLRDDGTLNGTESYHVTTDGLHLHPNILGEAVYVTHAPLLYVPTHPEVTSDEEIEELKRMTEMDTTGVERQASAITSHQMEADMDTMIHMYTPGASHSREST